jgi:ribulose-phosphate 3-epimerase
VARRLAPSVLNADLAHLAQQVRLVQDVAEWIHLDIMDGHFVPNLTFGPPVVAALRPYTDRFLDCHLMVDNPVELLPALAGAGANAVTMHVEALPDPGAALEAAAGHGLATGLAMRPDSSLDTVLPWLGTVDLLLPMTVVPGFGGQRFRADVLSKLAAARRAIDASGREIALQVDGGINLDTLPDCLAAGADVFVVGTGIFGADDPATAAKAFRSLIDHGPVATSAGHVPEPGSDDRAGEA